MEKALERLTSNIQAQMDQATVASPVTNVTNIIQTAPTSAPPDNFVTLAQLNAAVAAEAAARASADAWLQTQIDALQSPEVTNIALTCGTVAIGNGLENGSVTGLGLSFTPGRVLLTINKPVGGLDIWADLVGDPTTDGFDYILNGETDSGDYQLYYVIFPVLPNTTTPITFTVNGVPMPHGSFPLLSGTEMGTITGLGLMTPPSQVFLTVRRPTGGVNLFGTVEGSPTADGFDVTLSGMTDDVGYFLDYLVAPSPPTINLESGIEGGSVTGLGLTYTPARVILTVRTPVGGERLFANTVGSPTSDGFAFALSGITDSPDYKLEYVILA